MIAAILAFIKAVPELMALLKPLVDAYRAHEKAVVKAELDIAFDRLKEAKSNAEKAKALDQLDRDWKPLK